MLQETVEVHTVPSRPPFENQLCFSIKLFVAQWEATVLGTL
jgi:hypothetical protein